MKYLFYSLLLIPILGISQPVSNLFDIKYSGQDLSKKCGDYLEIYNRLPNEVRYGTDVQEGIIYFYFPSEKYFNLLFDKKTDGIAIDIVKRDQYKCFEKNKFSNSLINLGQLLPPMYKEEMVQNLIINDQGFVIVKYGKLPETFDPLNVECNLLVLQKKYNCGYHSFSNLDFSSWDILNMGLYRDSLSTEELNNQYKEVSKVLKFKIPFEKNKIKFNSKEIKPLYDSLKLTDYNIKELSIKAYTSVEGTLERNIRLQKGRAQSIVSALQAYQNVEIISTLSANENWVEFLKDIRDTKFQYLERLSKEEIKHALSDHDLLFEIEPLLKHHRKALVELKLQKRFSDEENNMKVLKSFFDQSVMEQNMTEALYIQQIIFEKIRNNNLPDDFIGKLEVPEESKYGPLLNNFAIFNYERNDAFIYENIENFERLLTIIPDNPKLKYNLIALKIKAWTYGELYTNRNEINRSIIELEKLGIEKSLTRRLRINYYIILTQYLSQEQDFKGKNKTLKNVYWLYSKLNLKDSDLLSLAKYLSFYSKFDWAERVLYKRVNEFDANEDLIFYYLKLTLNNTKKTRQSQYRTFLLNAIDKNNKRFCDIFLPKPQGGTTFQLLNNEYLRKTYCENCN